MNRVNVNGGRSYVGSDFLRVGCLHPRVILPVSPCIDGVGRSGMCMYVCVCMYEYVCGHQPPGPGELPQGDMGSQEPMLSVLGNSWGTCMSRVSG